MTRFFLPKVTPALAFDWAWTGRRSPRWGPVPGPGRDLRPVRADAAGEPVSRRRSGLRDDFALMRAAGINAIRTYHVPPEWLLDLADEHGASASSSTCPGRSTSASSRASEPRPTRSGRVRRAAESGATHPCVLAYSIGNEIPPDVVRWHGARRVERFLRRAVRRGQAGRPGRPGHLRQLPADRVPRPVVPRLRHVQRLPARPRRPSAATCSGCRTWSGDRPLVLGELGMDTLRHGEDEQADFLAGHLREAALMGAGRGVRLLLDRRLAHRRPPDRGLGVRHHRTPTGSPKRRSTPCARCSRRRLPALLAETPRVSVVVCSYNGGRTLDQCLRSLRDLDYPDYEVIVVDDGSTDDTRAIARAFPRRSGRSTRRTGA